jgi:hypothetical protein
MNEEKIIPDFEKAEIILKRNYTDFHMGKFLLLI